MQKNAPIILLGMHRSGTSMIAGMLEELGLFMGNHKDRNNEAFLFMKLNDWLMEQNSCSWDNPRSFSNFLENEDVRNLTTGQIQSILQSGYMMSYLGKEYFSQRSSSMQLDFPWAWKDPRATFTLPFWLEVFPGARIIHIFRNGIDVANSLKTRHENYLQRNMKKLKTGKYLPKYRFWKKMKLRSVGDSMRCSSLEGGFSLWEEHIEEARRHVATMGMDALEICYEDFITDPVAHLEKMTIFCKLQPGEEQLNRVAKRVNRNRINAFLDDPELTAFAQSVSARLKAHGYLYP
jgi:hypothetical protein